MLTARMVEKKILLITGPELRHRYYSNNLNHHFHLAGIIVEGSNYPQPQAQSSEEKDAWDWFFFRRHKHETKVFKNSDKLSSKNTPQVSKLSHGEINSRDSINTIKSIGPNLIALFGSSVLGSELLDLFPKRIFNLHVGLADRYRGSSCNFWPIYDRNLGDLGATIIRIDKGIDSGETLAQEKINLEEKDDEQSLIEKTIILGTKLMIDTIHKWMDGALKPLATSNKGKLFMQKDFTPESILRVRKMVEGNEIQGMIKTIWVRRKRSIH